jgi:hypothetical protein
MRTYKLVDFEVMSHDYYVFERYKGSLHLNWRDYSSPPEHLKKLKEEGWRVPTLVEGKYLYQLHEMNLLDFSYGANPYCNYFIEPVFYTLESKPRVISFKTGISSVLESKGTLALLRLVRSI